MYSSASLIIFRSSSFLAEEGLGVLPLMPVFWSGEMPHVSVGSMAAPSISTISSYSASASEAKLNQRSTALSQSAPVGANRRPLMYSTVVWSGFT